MGELPVAVIGAGPAGLTAAYQLHKVDHPTIVFEADDVVGGLSRTVERNGWRFDIGGHRFFTKVEAVQQLWEEILGPDDFVVRSRMSRIYYRGKFYDYPIRPLNALRNLGPLEAARCVGSFALARVNTRNPAENLEQYIVSNYGRRLYQHFFKTYNEKVWGVPAAELSADWGAQRIKGMSLFQAVWEPMRARLMGQRNDSTDQIASLIEEFHYPRLGPGMMWERCRDLVVTGGIPVETSCPVEGIRWTTTSGATHVSSSGHRSTTWQPVSNVISSMPLSTLVTILEPRAPGPVLAAAGSLRYRDFLTVALIVPESSGFPDNWIYIHHPGVRVGRIQNFGSWSPDMVEGGKTCLGLEYFVFEGDDLWSAPDADLIALAAAELEAIGLGSRDAVETGYVVRVSRAYPVYDDGYARAVETIREWLAQALPNVYPVGRNGMHKYNNQDHSMLTAMLSVECIVDGVERDIWAVNVEADYQESGPSSCSEGTGRSAPVLSPPRPVLTSSPG